MMTFGELLQGNKEAIVQRWFEDALATYSEDSAAAFRRQKDPFANPVGHSLHQGTRGIVEALLDGMDAEAIRERLREIIKIRAVQEFTASQAVDFVFRLKDAIRAELGNVAVEPRLASELARFERRIDGVALAAFDVFVQSREQVYELRINEVKRQVSWVVEKLNSRGRAPEATGVGPGLAESKGNNVRRGDLP